MITHLESTLSDTMLGSLYDIRTFPSIILDYNQMTLYQLAEHYSSYVSITNTKFVLNTAELGGVLLAYESNITMTECAYNQI